MMSDHSANLIFFNKIKTGRPEHLLTPSTSKDISVLTCPTTSIPPPPLKWMSYAYHPLMRKIEKD